MNDQILIVLLLTLFIAISFGAVTIYSCLTLKRLNDDILSKAQKYKSDSKNQLILESNKFVNKVNKTNGATIKRTINSQTNKQK